MTKIKCKLLEISHYIEYDDVNDINKTIIHQFTNWEEVDIAQYYELEEYVKKQNIKLGWNKKHEDNAKYLILVREPSPDKTATTIKKMLEEKEAERIAREEKIRKAQEARENARLEAEKKKELRRLKKLEKQIKELENLKAQKAQLEKKL